MANDLKAIRKRIASVKNTRQITRAMKLVAGAKLRRATDAAIAARPYHQKLNHLLADLLARTEDRSNPLFLPRQEVRRIRIIAFTADRGLCGSYNANVIKFVDNLMKEWGGKEVDIVAIGRKMADHVRRKGYTMARKLVEVTPKQVESLARELAMMSVRAYEKGEVDEVHLVYQRFKSAISQIVVRDPLLPLVVPETETGGGNQGVDFIYEPSQTAVIDALVPQVIANRVLTAFLEATASEHAARMTAMDNATRNASELIDKLTLDANKARQAAITKELVEIVSGAEAL